MVVCTCCSLKVTKNSLGVNGLTSSSSLELFGNFTLQLPVLAEVNSEEVTLNTAKLCQPRRACSNLHGGIHSQLKTDMHFRRLQANRGDVATLFYTQVKMKLVDTLTNVSQFGKLVILCLYCTKLYSVWPKLIFLNHSSLLGSGAYLVPIEKERMGQNSL